jgi:hypothetical protein
LIQVSWFVFLSWFVFASIPIQFGDEKERPGIGEVFDIGIKSQWRILFRSRFTLFAPVDSEFIGRGA